MFQKILHWICLGNIFNSPEGVHCIKVPLSGVHKNFAPVTSIQGTLFTVLRMSSALRFDCLAMCVIIIASRDFQY